MGFFEIFLKKKLNVFVAHSVPDCNSYFSFFLFTVLQTLLTVLFYIFSFLTFYYFKRRKLQFCFTFSFFNILLFVKTRITEKTIQLYKIKVLVKWHARIEFLIRSDSLYSLRQPDCRKFGWGFKDYIRRTKIGLWVWQWTSYTNLAAIWTHYQHRVWHKEAWKDLAEPAIKGHFENRYTKCRDLQMTALNWHLKRSQIRFWIIFRHLTERKCVLQWSEAYSTKDARQDVVGATSLARSNSHINMCKGCGVLKPCGIQFL